MYKMNISGNDSKAPLYFQYKGQLQAQPAYVELDPYVEVDEVLSADYSGEIGNSIPINVFTGHILRYPIPNNVSLAALEALDEDDEFQELVNRVIAGHDLQWDGSKYVGVLDDDAKSANEAIEAKLSDLDTIEVGDVFFSMESTSSSELLAMVANAESFPKAIDEVYKNLKSETDFVYVSSKDDTKEYVVNAVADAIFYISDAASKEYMVLLVKVAGMMRESGDFSNSLYHDLEVIKERVEAFTA